MACSNNNQSTSKTTKAVLAGESPSQLPCPPSTRPEPRHQASRSGQARQVRPTVPAAQPTADVPTRRPHRLRRHRPGALQRDHPAALPATLRGRGGGGQVGLGREEGEAALAPVLTLASRSPTATSASWPRCTTSGEPPPQPPALALARTHIHAHRQPLVPAKSRILPGCQPHPRPCPRGKGAGLLGSQES